MLNLFIGWFAYCFIFFTILLLYLTVPLIAFFLIVELIRKVCKMFKR